MSKTYKDKRKFLDRENGTKDHKPPKFRQTKGRKKTEQQQFEELMNNENFTLGI